MSRSDFTVFCMNGQFEITHKQTGKIVHVGEGGIPTAEKWIKEYIQINKK